MTYDSATVENDPFLIEMREEVNRLEALKNAAWDASEADPTDARKRIAYDVAWFRFDDATTKYEKALKAVIGL
jgi:hypothetical protein